MDSADKCGRWNRNWVMRAVLSTRQNFSFVYSDVTVDKMMTNSSCPQLAFKHLKCNNE